jgi:hypothetical protein
VASTTKRGEKIKKYILKNIEQHPKNVVALTGKEFGITRQAINRYIRVLVKDGLIKAEGKTSQRKYTLPNLVSEIFEFDLAGLEEHEIWNQQLSPLLDGFPENVMDIWHYGCTEMINNAIDHSNGSQLTITVAVDSVRTYIQISDNGIGIFKKIKEECNLEDERHAVLELSKGKLTTDPDNHTGEGIFFSSRMFDRYLILSGGVDFLHDYDDEEENEEEDWIWEREQHLEGTHIYMVLENDSERIPREIFDRFTSNEDDYGFTKTVVPVRLAKHGLEKLISRSQAKRLLARVDRFKTVVLDFREVETIGQAFADEIFRVFARNHQGIKIKAAFANKEIQKMIKRARAVE